MSDWPLIDKRVRHVGTSHLRKFNAARLRDLGDTVFVIQENDKPLSVLLSYRLFIQIQERIENGLQQVRALRGAGQPEGK